MSRRAHIRRMRRAWRKWKRTRDEDALRVYLVERARAGIWDPRYCISLRRISGLGGPVPVPPDGERRLRQAITRGVAAGLVPTSTKRAPRFPGDRSYHIEWDAVDLGVRKSLIATGEGRRRMVAFQTAEHERSERVGGYEELIGPVNTLCILRGMQVDLVEGTPLEEQHDTHVHLAFVGL